MKKYMITIMMIMIIFTLSACGSKDESEKNPLDDIMADNPTLMYKDDNEEPLKVGMTLQYPPFETIDINGDAIGVSVEMAYELGMFLEREVEIVDLLNLYKSKNQLSADLIGRGGAWLDTGSIEDFYKTSTFVSAIENRQGFKIACIEEIALNNKWITAKEINNSIKFYGNCDYSRYLRNLIKK